MRSHSASTERVNSRPAAQEYAVAGALALVVLLIGLIAPVSGPVVPPAAMVIPVLAGGVTLRVRPLGLVFGAVVVVLIWDAAWVGFSAWYPATLAVLLAAAYVAYIVCRSRTTVGVQGLRGEAMLVDLSERLLAHGEMPTLPRGWRSDVAVRTAGGASFGGDFVVAARTNEGSLLEIVLVDVSGKGMQAGTRALQLSGALGGLLGAVPPAEFLSRANDYLLRLLWDEGFATAVHVVVDLDAGTFTMESAGHLPAVHFVSGSGTWRLLTAEGAVLGVLPKARFSSARGWIGPGDAILLYTDGLIEEPGRDLDVGLDKLLGEAERLVPRGFEGGALRLLEAVAPSASDDRAVVLLWRV